ncbi:hypothetical protein [Ruegeria atlantica]|uniref:hypothetical protein n=1 Tax=Ruegeria atlantica TaxID=81569 RepID=UPI00147BA8FB|nr:hypothetical protein [Ruegeria atlantica]
MTDKRVVDTLPGAKKEVLDTLETLSEECINGVLMVLMELENPDPAIQPNLEHRCGLLDDKYEIISLPIPDCRKYRLVISIASKDLIDGDIHYHGAAPAGKYTCETGKNLAASQYKLVNPVWEPKS